jgi:glycosyltransferase involved in cell wall biosynthesis
MSPLAVNIRTRGRLPVLTEVLDGVVAQTIRFFEAVVVDDASCDATDEWLARQSDELVTAIVFEEQTGGLLAATEESSKLREGGLGTPRTSPRKGRVARSPRRAEDSAGNRSLELNQKIVDGELNQEIVDCFPPDPGRRGLGISPCGGGFE